MAGTPLPTRPLGRSGLEITTVGFGAWAVGGGAWAYGWGPQDDEQSLDAMHRAVALGVNWIDTAAVYGLGHSEELVGRLLRELPGAERPLVFTKCGMVWDERDRMASPVQTLAPRLRARGSRSLAAAARRRAHRPLPVSLAGRGRHPDRGVMGSAGAVGGGRKGPRGRGLQLRRSAARTVRGHPPRGFAAAAVLRSSGGRRPPPRSPGAPRTGPASSCYSPMQSGLLTDRSTPQRVAGLADDDWRRRSPDLSAPAGAQPCASGRAAARSPAARHHRVGDVRGLDPGVARSERRDRRGPLGSARWRAGSAPRRWS